MEAAIDLDFLAGLRLLAEFVIDAGQGHVRLGVIGIDARGFAEFDDGVLGAVEVFKNSAQLKMGLREIWIEADGLAQVGFRIGKLVEKLLGDGEIQIGPRGRMRRGAIEVDGFLVVFDGEVILVLIVVAEAEVVIGAGHLRGEFDGVLKVVNGFDVKVAVVVEAAEPVGIEAFIGAGGGEGFEDGAGPVGLRDADVGHGERESEARIERGDGFGFLPGDGGVHVVTVQEVDAAGEGEQARGLRGVGGAVDFGEKKFFGGDVVACADGLLESRHLRGSESERFDGRSWRRGLVGWRLPVAGCCEKIEQQQGGKQAANNLRVAEHHG